MLFHGSGLEPGSWFRGPVNVADQVGASGLADVLVVAPSRAASGDDFVEYSIDPLLDVLEASAGGLPERATFVGFSAGGDTAVRTAVASSRIEVDSVVLGASIWGLPLTNLVSPGQWKPNVLVDTGDDDGLGRLTPDIVAAFESAGVDVRVQQSPGRHNLEFVAAQMESWLRWIAEQPAT